MMAIAEPNYSLLPSCDRSTFSLPAIILASAVLANGQFTLAVNPSRRWHVSYNYLSLGIFNAYFYAQTVEFTMHCSCWQKYAQISDLSKPK